MNKLDNKGWGLSTMIVYSSIIIFFLLIATYFVIVLYHGLSEDLKQETNQAQIIDKKNQAIYNSYLVKMNTAAETYFLNQSPNQEQAMITLKVLIEENYLDNIYDPIDNKLCSGYSHKQTIAEEIVITSYLKCSNYISRNYGA